MIQILCQNDIAFLRCFKIKTTSGGVQQQKTIRSYNKRDKLQVVLKMNEVTYRCSMQQSCSIIN